MSAGVRRQANRPNSSRAASFQKNSAACRCNLRHFFGNPEPVEAIGVSYRGTAPEAKMRLSIRDFLEIPHPTFHIAIA